VVVGASVCEGRRACERGREGEGERGRVRCAAAAAVSLSRDVGLDQLMQRKRRWNGRDEG
jgi:hypothetical protein